MPDATATEVLQAISSLRSDMKASSDKLDKASQPKNEGRSFGVRRGENSLTSRGYSYLKAWGLLAGQIDKSNAQVEVQVAERLRKHYDGFGFKRSLPNSIFMPVCSSFIMGDEVLANEVGELVKAGNPGAIDLQRIRSDLSQLGMTKALSWIDETVGGTLIAPPAYGELIEVLRNNAVFLAAGARVLPMPPQGRLTVPRQTSAMTAYHVGESQNLTESTPGTDDLVMQAKKLTVLAKIPNELFHFAAIPIEAFVREDMGQVIGLKMDKTLLEDIGSTTTPKGIVNYSQINVYTSYYGTAADANSGYPLQPEDVSNAIAMVEEANATFKTFIMRPQLWATLVNRRADAVSAGDGKGMFLFNILRDWGLTLDLDRLKIGHLNGYPVYKTTQLSKTRTRGSGTTQNTYMIGGNFNDYMIAMGGAMEFQVSTQGDTPFIADQTWMKGVMYYDAAPRHEASFVLIDNLLQNR